MGYLRQSGAKWAGKHPKGSAVLGIIFGLIITVIGFANNASIIGIVGICYTLWCVYLLFKDSDTKDTK